MTSQTRFSELESKRTELIPPAAAAGARGFTGTPVHLSLGDGLGAAREPTKGSLRTDAIKWRIPHLRNVGDKEDSGIT